MAFAKPRFFTSLFFTVLLMVCIGEFAVYALEDESSPSIYEEIIAVNTAIDPMIVNASWLDGEMLRIDVVDSITGTASSLAVRLSDFVTNMDAQNSRYILIQAADLDGNLSGTIQIDNPFYVPAVAMEDAVGFENAEGNTGNTAILTDSGEDNYYNTEAPQHGLTPDGTGTVVDNIITQNEIEFFTVYTEEGNVFFLVVDRQRNTDNVYLLNAVTEADLIALAEQSDSPINSGISAVPEPPPLEIPAVEYEQQPEPQPEPEADTEAPPARRGNTNFVFIALIVVAVGGVAYYFKIVKGKKSSAPPDDDDWEYEGDEEYLDGDDTDDTAKGGDDE